MSSPVAEQKPGLISLAKTLLQNRFFRYLLVGGLNTLFGFSAYAILVYFGMHYVWASLISTTLGVLFNFQTTGRLVFGSHQNALIFRFVLVYVLIYGIQIGFLRLFELASVGPIIAGAILILPMAAVAYVLNKVLVFKVT